MKLEKKHWIIIGVVVAIIAIWYFFLRKKKTESGFMMPTGGAMKMCANGQMVPNNMPCPPYDPARGKVAPGTSPKFSPSLTTTALAGANVAGGSIGVTTPRPTGISKAPASVPAVKNPQGVWVCPSNIPCDGPYQSNNGSWFCKCNTLRAIDRLQPAVEV